MLSAETPFTIGRGSPFIRRDYLGFCASIYILEYNKNDGFLSSKKRANSNIFGTKSIIRPAAETMILSVLDSRFQPVAVPVKLTVVKPPYTVGEFPYLS